MYTLWNTAAVGTLINESLVKEDVGDLISNLFPLETPLQGLLEHVSMPREQQSNPVDTYDAGRINRLSAAFAASAQFATTNAKPEGYIYTDRTSQYPRLILSVNEIQGDQFSVSGSDRGTPMYGMADRFAFEGLKTTKAIAVNFEHSFWWSPGTVPAGADLNSGADTTYQIARQTQGIMHWIFKSGLQRSKIGLAVDSFLDGHGNNFGDEGLTNPGALGNASSHAYDAGGLALDDTMFRDNIMSPWYRINGQQGGSMGFCSPKIKGMFARFAQTANGPVNERTIEASAKRITDVVDHYETEFGVVSISMTRYLDIAGQTVTIAQSTGTTVVPYDECLIFIQPKYWKIGVRRPIFMSPLGKTGDKDSGLIVGEMGIICLNPSGGVGATNLVP